jgi:hypothetical protein
VDSGTGGLSKPWTRLLFVTNCSLGTIMVSLQPQGFQLVLTGTFQGEEPQSRYCMGVDVRK